MIQNGIREPLYVTALKDLGVDVTSMEHLSDLSQVDLTNITVMAPSSIQEEVPQDKLLTVEQLHFAYQENRSILKISILRLIKVNGLPLWEKWCWQVNFGKSYLPIYHARR